MNQTNNAPIFLQFYGFYKEIYKLRRTIPKQDRYTLWQKIESLTLEIMEEILRTFSYKENAEKLITLKNVSIQLNLLRVFIRLSRDTKVIDIKKYILLEEKIDEIGKMLGGWIKSVKST